MEDELKPAPNEKKDVEQLIKRNKLKAKYYFDSKSEVSIRTDFARYYSGKIISIEDDYINFDDNRLGKIMITLEEIELMEPALKKREYSNSYSPSNF